MKSSIQGNTTAKDTATKELHILNLIRTGTHADLF